MSDEAEAGVVAEILLVAAAVGAAILFLVFYAAEDGGPPPALGLSDEGAAEDGTMTLTLISKTTDVEWGELELRLDGEPLSYSATLASDATYCVVATGDACSANDPRRPLEAGQQVKVHDEDIEGKTLTIGETSENHLLFSRVIHG